MADADKAPFKIIKPSPETQFPGLKDDGPREDDAPAQAAAQSSPAIAPVEAASESDELPPMTVPRRALKAQSRRDFLLYGAGAVGAALGFVWLLPDETRGRLGLKPVAQAGRKARFLDRVLTVDDDVAAALYSPGRLVPTYDMAQAATELRNNYDGQTPAPDYIPDWRLTVTGLASGKVEHLAIQDIHTLIAAHGGRHDQVTRLVCVEGWSQIAGWGGLRFADFLKAYPPMAGAKWARLDSSVNLDSDGNPDPYYVSIDLPTARHPQVLLATHQNDAHRNLVPLTVEHGAPLRLLVPMKLGLKNIKAITKISYTAEQPKDYWSDEGRGYSRYDGL
jgi:DMSO/TMAO reductase YedYZ molybdopterin-dependent catalytic subunit